MAICVMAGSKTFEHPAFAEAATELGTLIARAGEILVVGGAGKGLMKACADAAAAEGGRVEVVIPALWHKHEPQPAYAQVTEVLDQRERDEIFVSRAFGFVALPGGPGTAGEIFALATGRQYGQHTHSLAALNICGFWNGLATLVQTMENAGVLSASVLHLAETPAQAVAWARHASPAVQ